MGTADKKWNGAAKEIFTTADKYHVSINRDISGIHRVVIVSVAIVVDMVMKE
jgi:uncharacterized protein YxjI